MRPVSVPDSARSAVSPPYLLRVFRYSAAVDSAPPECQTVLKSQEGQLDPQLISSTIQRPVCSCSVP